VNSFKSSKRFGLLGCLYLVSAIASFDFLPFHLVVIISSLSESFIDFKL